MILLKNVLKDPRFVEEGRLFGIDLISNIVKSPLIQEDFKQLVIRTLTQESVRKETVEVLRYIVGRAEAEDIIAAYFKTVFIREDMLKGVTGLLTKAAVATMEHPTTKEKFGQFAVKVAGNDIVKSKLYENYLYKPAKRLFSFGIYGNGEEAKSDSGVAVNNQ